MFKVKHKMLPQNILDLFRNESKRYNLRNSDFFIPRVNSTRYGQHSLRYYGPFLWAKLPYEIRIKNTVTSFKDKIRSIDLTKLVKQSCPQDCYLCNS